MDDFVLGTLILAIIGIVVYFLPAIIAYKRNHHYRHIILVLNIFGFSIVTWLVAIVWAVFPSEKSLIDPVMGSVTGKTDRNSGHTLGEVEAAKHNTVKAHIGSPVNKEVTEKLERLLALRENGQISKEEYDLLKEELIK